MKSKRPNGSIPFSWSSSAARMFGGVPTSVVVPPRIAPKESGMNRRDGAIPLVRAALATAGNNTAVAAMLFMKAESSPAPTMMTMMSGTSRPPMSAFSRSPTKSASPVFSIAVLTKKIDSIVMTAGEENPVKASAGVTNPASVRTTRPRNAVRSMGSFSVKKK